MVRELKRNTDARGPGGHQTFRGFVMPGKGEERCQGNQNIPALRTDARSWWKPGKGTARSTGRKRQEPTRSTDGTNLYAAGTDGHGHASAHGTQRNIPSANSALSAAFLFRSRKSTTSFRWQKVGHMIRTILYPFASRVTPASMQSGVTDGENQDGRGGKNLREHCLRGTVPARRAYKRRNQEGN